MRVEKPFTVSRVQLPSGAPIETTVYENLDEALADAAGLIAFADFAIEVTVADNAGTELYKRVSSNA